MSKKSDEAAEREFEADATAKADAKSEAEYVYPYGEHQVHEALVDLDKRLRKLEPK